MQLNSFSFIIYFIALFIIMAGLELVGKKAKWARKVQLITLLLFSYIFISSWKFCICVLGYTIFVYFVGLKLKRNKLLLIFGIAMSITMLGYFKYTNFFLEEFNYIFGNDFVALNIILPIGISFYTFSGLAYIIDVYRGDYDAEKNILNLALYISFFTKITAGPIVRGRDFFPQLNKYKGIQLQNFADGIQIFVFGLFKKMVLADHLGIFVDDVFYAPTAYNTGTVILATVSYSLQIYFDFKPNFNLPYIANGMSDFWKRWHISLSSWFQDYLYIPLGG